MKEKNKEEKREQAKELKKILKVKKELDDNTLEDIADIIYNEKVEKYNTENNSKEER